jgi:hypothetical protein
MTEANQEKMEALEEAMDSDLREMKADLRTQIGCLASRMDSHHEELKARMYANLEQMTTTESEAVSEHQKVPNENAAMEKIGALEDRYGDQHLAVRRHGQLKKRAQGDGGSSFLHRARNTVIRDIQQRDEGPKHKTTAMSGKENTLHEAPGQNFELEAVKIAVTFFGRPRKMKEWALWRSRRRRHVPSEKKEIVTHCTLLGTNSLKEEAMWHICSKPGLWNQQRRSLLGNGSVNRRALLGNDLVTVT